MDALVGLGSEVISNLILLTSVLSYDLRVIVTAISLMGFLNMNVIGNLLLVFTISAPKND